MASPGQGPLRAAWVRTLRLFFCCRVKFPSSFHRLFESASAACLASKSTGRAECSRRLADQHFAGGPARPRPPAPSAGSAAFPRPPPAPGKPPNKCANEFASSHEERSNCGELVSMLASRPRGSFAWIGLSWGSFGVLIGSEAFLGRLFARFDAAACSKATTATPICEGTVALGLGNIDPSLHAEECDEPRSLQDRRRALLSVARQ